MKKFIIALLIVLLNACSPIYVNYDYDKTINFKIYKTYQYFGDLDTGLNELDTKRLLDALDKNLKLKGFSISETPDFLIDIKTIEYKNPQRENVGVGIGGGNRNVGGGVSIGLPIGQPSTMREIIFDFVDANKKQLFWQAKSESSFNQRAIPEKKEERLIAIVEKVFKNFPPNR